MCPSEVFARLSRQQRTSIGFELTKCSAGSVQGVIDPRLRNCFRVDLIVSLEQSQGRKYPY